MVPFVTQMEPPRRNMDSCDGLSCARCPVNHFIRTEQLGIWWAFELCSISMQNTWTQFEMHLAHLEERRKLRVPKRPRMVSGKKTVFSKIWKLWKNFLKGPCFYSCQRSVSHAAARLLNDQWVHQAAWGRRLAVGGLGVWDLLCSTVQWHRHCYHLPWSHRGTCRRKVFSRV